MAHANENIIRILRKTAQNLEDTDHYAWGHVGMCNCGHLIQSVTALSSQEIIRCAQQSYLDEWTEFANDYCPATGSLVDDLISALIREGFQLQDIHHLEYLSDKTVLNALPNGFRYLQRNNRYDVALYMRTWAALLELALKDRLASEGAVATVDSARAVALTV
jgi:hypothetical protein